MMKEAASFSLKPGLKRCLQDRKTTHPENEIKAYFVDRFALMYSLQQLNGLSSETREASVQHESYQGDHCIHVGSEVPQGCLSCYGAFISDI